MHAPLEQEDVTSPGDVSDSVDDVPSLPEPRSRRSCACWLASLLGVAATLMVVFLRGPMPHSARDLSIADLFQLAKERALDDQNSNAVIRGGNKIDEEDVDQATCTGHVIAASAWTASLGLKVRAAIQDCDPSTYAEPAARAAPGDAATPGGLPGGFVPNGQDAYDLRGGGLFLDQLSWKFGDEWTIEGWFFPSERGNGTVWTTRETQSGTPGCAMSTVLFTSGQQSIESGSQNSTAFCHRSALETPPGQWAFLVWQRRGNQIEYFIDGKPAGTASAISGLDNLINQELLELGRTARNMPTVGDYSGWVLDVRLTSRALYASGQSFEPPADLQIGPNTMFLLKEDYMDVVSGRQMAGGAPALSFPALADPQATVVNEGERLRPPTCSRAITQVMADCTQIATLLEGAAATCQHGVHEGLPCTASVTRALNAAFKLARFGSDLGIFCPQDLSRNDDFFLCADRLEAVAWQLDILGTSIGQSTFTCTSRRDGEPLKDIGACVGELVAAGGYVSSASLYMTSAVRHDCPSSVNPDEIQSFLADEVAQEHARIDCARDSSAFVRSLGLGASKAIRAGGHCGGTNTVCGRSISRSAATLAGAAEAASFMKRFCVPKTKCCTWEEEHKNFTCRCDAESKRINAETDERNEALCTRFSASMVKELAVSAALAAEAAGQCGGKDETFSTEEACASLIGKGVAGFGLLIESLSRVAIACPQKEPRQWFGCGQLTGIAGTAIDVISRAIGAATLECGWGNLGKRQTQTLQLPRFFFRS